MRFELVPECINQIRRQVFSEQRNSVHHMHSSPRRQYFIDFKLYFSEQMSEAVVTQDFIFCQEVRWCPSLAIGHGILL